MKSLSAEYKDLYLSVILMLLLSWAFAFIKFVSLHVQLFNILMTALYTFSENMKIWHSICKDANVVT